MSRLVLPRSKYGPGRKHWLEARRAAITGTDAAAILGVHPYQSPLSVYVDKLYPRTDDLGDQAEAAHWGNLLEPVIAGEFRRRTGLHLVRCAGLEAHDERDWQLATIDYNILDDSDGAAVLECKTTGLRNSAEWPAEGEPPPFVQAQVMHQLIVKGARAGWVAALIGGQSFRTWRIEYDPDLADEITRRELEFWQRLQDQNPPAPIGHDADDDALTRLYPGDQEREADLTQQTADVEERVKLAGLNTAIKAELATLDQRIKAAMGDATEGYIGNHLVATWRVSHPHRFNLAAFREYHPQIVDEFMQEHTQRTLLYKKKGIDRATGN